mmetsp:Transcript_20887/g.18245  ORF Transcript_20887/g.18245 Transcript_20887/m.18245 type:complete len:133 (+) Transcript_20887:1147-1545(+)
MNYQNPVIEKFKMEDEKPSIEEIRNNIVENTHVWQKLYESGLLEDEIQAARSKNLHSGKTSARSKSSNKKATTTTNQSRHSKKSGGYESIGHSSVVSGAENGAARKRVGSTPKIKRQKSKTKKKSPSPLRAP